MEKSTTLNMMGRDTQSLQKVKVAHAGQRQGTVMTLEPSYIENIERVQASSPHTWAQ